MSPTLQMLALTAWLGFNVVAVCVLLLCSAFRKLPPVTEQDL